MPIHVYLLLLDLHMQILFHAPFTNIHYQITLLIFIVFVSFTFFFSTFFLSLYLNHYHYHYVVVIIIIIFEFFSPFSFLNSFISSCIFSSNFVYAILTCFLMNFFLFAFAFICVPSTNIGKIY